LELELSDIAGIVKGRIIGNEHLLIAGINSLDKASDGDISFFFDSRYKDFVKDTRASALIVSEPVELYKGSQVVVSDPDLQKEIEKQSLMLSSEAKENKQNEYDRKNREIGYLSQDLSEDAQTAQQNANQKMLRQLYSVIQSLAKLQAFDLVMEKSNSSIIYTSDAIDITDQVIKELNKVKP